MKRTFTAQSIFAAVLVLVSAGWFSCAPALAQGATCTVTGTVLGGDNLPKANIRLTITPLTVNGLLVSSASFYSSFSGADGVLTFTAIRGGVYNIRGNALQFTGTGRNVTIPSASTATLESLQAVSSIPDEGLTIKSNNVAFGNRFGTLDFSSSFTVTESPTGELNVDITGAGITSLGGLTGASQTFATGTSGSDFGISSSGSTHTFNLPTASGSNRGLLSSSDWTTFNAKLAQAAADLLYQPLDTELSALAGLTSAADRLPYFTGAGAASTAVFTSFGRSLIDDTDAAAARTTLSLVPGTNVQAFHQNLADIAGLSDPNADRLLFWDDSAGAYKHLTLGTNLSITDTTINAAGGGGGTPGGSSGDIQYNDGGSFAGALLKQGSNLIEQRNGTNAQKLAVYNTYTAADNYNRILIDAGSNYGAIMMAGAGGSAFSGSVFYIANSVGSLQFQTNGNGRWNMNTAGHFLANDDNAYDFGAPGATRPRSGYFGTSVVAPLYNFTSTVTPSGSADSQGATGDMRYDDNFIYVKTAGGGWKRATLTTF